MSPSSCAPGSPSGFAPSGASSSFGAAPSPSVVSPSCGAAAGASFSCGGAGASSSCAAAAGAGAPSSCAAAALASACAAASAGPPSSCGGAGGWSGGSPWGWFFFGVGGFDEDILMVWVGVEVHNFIGLVRLPPPLLLVQLLIRFAFGGEHLAGGHELRPAVLFLLPLPLLAPLLARAPLIVGDDDGDVVLRGPPGPCWLVFGSFHNHRRDRSGAVDDPPRLDQSWRSMSSSLSHHQYRA